MSANVAIFDGGNFTFTAYLIRGNDTIDEKTKKISFVGILQVFGTNRISGTLIDLGPDTEIKLGDTLRFKAFKRWNYDLNMLWSDGSTNYEYDFIAQQWGIGQQQLICTATDTFGCQIADTVNIIVGTTSVENTTSSFIEIMPNPAHDFIQITNKNGQQNTYFCEIYSHTGKFVKSGYVKNNILNISNLPSGNYMIIIRDAENSINFVTKQLVVL